MKYPWRIWRAFEVRPGITRTVDTTEHLRSLRRQMRDANEGKLNFIEYERWMELLIDRNHAWGYA